MPKTLIQLAGQDAIEELVSCLVQDWASSNSLDQFSEILHEGDIDAVQAMRAAMLTINEGLYSIVQDMGEDSCGEAAIICAEELKQRCEVEEPDITIITAIADMLDKFLVRCKEDETVISPDDLRRVNEIVIESGMAGIGSLAELYSSLVEATKPEADN